MAIGLPETFVKGKSYPLKSYSIRGLALSAEDMLLCLPVQIRDKEGAYSQKGIIAGCAVNIISESLLRVDLYARIDPTPELTISCKINIPEINNDLELSGTIAAIRKESYDRVGLYYKIELSDIQANEETLSLFKPGCLMESIKSWDDIKRK